MGEASQRPKSREMRYVFRHLQRSSGRHVDGFLESRGLYEGDPRLLARAVQGSLDANRRAGTGSEKFQASVESIERALVYLRANPSEMQKFAREVKAEEEAAAKARAKVHAARVSGKRGGKRGVEGLKPETARIHAGVVAKRQGKTPGVEVSPPGPAPPKPKPKKARSAKGAAQPGGSSASSGWTPVGDPREVSATKRGATGWGQLKTALAGLWGQRKVARKLTLMGLVIVRIPPFVPVVVAVWFALSVASMVYAIITESTPTTAVEFGSHAIAAPVSVFVNVNLLYVNAIVTGLSALFRVVIVGGVEVIAQVVQLMLGGLYHAVNALLENNPIVEGHVEPPRLEPSGFLAGPWFSLAYVYPAGIVECTDQVGSLVVTADCGPIFRTGKSLLNADEAIFSMPHGGSFSLRPVPSAFVDGVVTIGEGIATGVKNAWVIMGGTV